MDRNPLPEPPSKIGGLASAPNPPKRGIAGAIDYEFSHDFPQGARDQVKKEEIRVAREFTKEADTARTVKDLRALRMRCAMSLALAFCREAVQLRWSADRIDSEFREFILAAGNWAGLEPTSVSQLEFEQTTEWREYQNLMLASGEGAASQEVEEERLATKVLGSSRPVSLVRHPGTAQEVRLARRMGGDFRKLALFLPDDRVEIADELLCDIFDEPRIVAGVEAIVVQHRVFRWEAQILPRSEWNRRHGFGSLSVDPGSRPAATYPLAMHHPAKESVTVYSAKEEAGLGAGWSRVYIHRAYPKCKYHWNGKNTIVKNLDEELALGGGWAGTPAAFEAYRGPRRAIPDRSNPIKWVDDWTPAGVSADLRIKIKAQLKRAHGAFWKSPDAATAITHSMRLAFDGIAKGRRNIN